VIRSLVPADRPAVVEVWRVCGRDPLPPEEVAAVRANAPELLLVGDEGPAGVVGVVVGTSDGRRGWIQRLAVLPGHRRGGLGGALVAELERRFAARGLTRVNLLALPGDEDAQRFWARRGYAACPDVLRTRALP
jgi:ribosomal protein S18 acetylase RimI-like enzyme